MHPSRVLPLALIGSVVLGLASPVTALAGDPATEFRPGAGTGLEQESSSAAGYTSRDRANGMAWVEGELTVPTLGDCSDGDGGVFTAIELSHSRGSGRYAAGGVYSTCLDGVPSHIPVFETTTEGQMMINEVVEDGDEINVFLPVNQGEIRIEFENLTQGWSLGESFDEFRPTDASVLYRRTALDGVPLPVLHPRGAGVINVFVNGHPLDQTRITKFILVDDGGEPQVKPSRIKNGRDFRFKHVA